jgi:hypothetical protein
MKRIHHLHWLLLGCLLGTLHGQVQLGKGVQIGGTATGPGTTINGLSGAVTLQPGTNITITPSGNTLTFANSGVTGSSLTLHHLVLGNSASAIFVDPNASTDGAGNLTTVSNTTGVSNTTSQNNQSVNYPLVTAGGQHNYVANLQNCDINETFSLSSVAAGSYCFAIAFDTVTNPGGNYGVPGDPAGATGPTSNVGWFVHSTIGGFIDPNTVNKYNAGITNVYGLPMFATGPGDINYFNMDIRVKPAWIVSADEGLSAYLNAMSELAPGVWTVATGGSGANTLTLNCTSNCGNMGLNSPMIDYNSAVTGTVTAVTNSVTIGPTTGASLVTTSGFSAFTPSTQATIATNIVSPYLIPNTTGKLSANTLTVTLNGLSGAVVGTHLASFIGPVFYEVVLLTPGAYSGGSQTFTGTFHYSHTAGATVCIGGSVGSYLEFTNYTQGSGAGAKRYLENVLCSTSTTALWIGHQAANANFIQAGAAAEGGVSTGPVTMYQGGEVYGILDGSGNPSNGVVNIGDNAAAWTVGDAVENTNNIAANVKTVSGEEQLDNPYMLRAQEIETWRGHGGAHNTQANGWKIGINPNASTDYVGSTNGSAVYQAPGGTSLSGAWACGICMLSAPLPATSETVNGIPNVGGYVIGVGGPDANASSQVERIIGPALDFDQSWIRYDAANHNWLIDAFNAASGQQILVDGVALCYANGTGCPPSFANPMTTLGDAIYGGASGVATRLAGPTTTGHTFFYGWQPSGSAIAPTAVDLSGSIGTTQATSDNSTKLATTAFVDNVLNAQFASGQTSSIGGGSLTAGTCASGTATATGALSGSPVVFGTSDGTLPSPLVVISAAVTSANTITVQVCAIATVTPAAKLYNVVAINPVP